MLRAVFKEMKPFPQLMFAIFVVVASFIVFMIISLVVAIPLFGFDSMMSMAGGIDVFNGENIALLKYFQVVQSVGVFIVPPFILAWLYYGKIAEYLQLNKTATTQSVLLVLILGFSAIPVINLFGELNANMKLPEWLSGLENWIKTREDMAAELTEKFLKVDSFGGFLFNLFMIAFLPAIGEELLFRGVVQRIFSNWTRSLQWGIWIAAALFSALHLQFYGFIPRMLLGVMFGYLLIWSGSIWLPIIAHFINNGVAVTGMYLIDKGAIKPEFEEIGSSGEGVYFSIVSIAVVALLLWLIKRENRPAVKEQRYLQ